MPVSTHIFFSKIMNRWPWFGMERLQWGKIPPATTPAGFSSRGSASGLVFLGLKLGTVTATSHTASTLPVVGGLFRAPSPLICSNPVEWPDTAAGLLLGSGGGVSFWHSGCVFTRPRQQQHWPWSATGQKACLLCTHHNPTNSAASACHSNT